MRLLIRAAGVALAALIPSLLLLALWLFVQPLLIESGVLLCLGQRLCLPPAQRRLFILHGILADCFVSTRGYVTKGRL